MIDPKRLVDEAKRFLPALEQDLRERCEEVEGADAALREDYARAHELRRTAEPYEAWRDSQLTQIAAAWFLGCVFVRFLEDNGLLPEPLLSGPGEARRHAMDRHEAYFRDFPGHSDRDYLLSVFEIVAAYPAVKPLFDELHNPLYWLGLSADGARSLVGFWRELDADGALVHDFTDPTWNTRFLGDLYQDLSEAVRKKYALLQTPEFVEAFILDRTLEPALETFGHETATLIDPTCGSGHFLLGAFQRILARYRAAEPGANPRHLVQRTLHQIAGVDVNPYATAISRLRLILAALAACDIQRLQDAPGFELCLATGDSLLHGRRPGKIGQRQESLVEDELYHVYHTEDEEALATILSRRYHAVVGNPPYITVKDRAMNQAYRDRFGACYRLYSLSVPFFQRFFDLAMHGDSAESETAGFVGMITSNSFMKREFGKKLIQEFIPRWDMTHVIDTSGAYIPGHGTPTVIVFGRHRKPVSSNVRAVLGIRGEPSTPADPARGRVWVSILEQTDLPGSENDFVSVKDTPREAFHGHPWSIGGGGASELKEKLESKSDSTLSNVIREIGFGVVTREDDVFRISLEVGLRKRIPRDQLKPLVAGDEIRDWMVLQPVFAIWPYDPSSLNMHATEEVTKQLWRWRTQLSSRVAFGKTQIERGLAWQEYSMFFKNRYRTPLSIAFAFVATHNHFVLDRGGKVFKQSAPVIKLPPEATEEDHLALLGLLNSSTACFWMKQVFYPKGGDHVGKEGARVRRTLWDERYEFDGTKLQKFRLAGVRPVTLSQKLDELGQEIGCLESDVAGKILVTGSDVIAESSVRFHNLLHTMIALQEELDWECYRLYGLVDSRDFEYSDGEPPPVKLGERAFEIVLARKVAAGQEQTEWFHRHGSTPITEVPDHWPESYRALVERRIRAIETLPEIQLIERPEYKRRWNQEPWETRVERTLRAWLLDRLEKPELWSDLELVSTARLADRMQGDADFMKVAALYRGREDFDLNRLVTELVESQAVPYLAVLRYKPDGLRKRKAWEKTWDLQRQEDAIDARTRLSKDDPRYLQGFEAEEQKKREVGDIPVPPRYASKDFLKSTYWSLRGKLDVPKERFILYPYAERDVDPTPVVGWAGWDHLEQAKALASFVADRKEQDGWGVDKLTSLYAGILELLPWLQQWHDEPEPGQVQGMGSFFAQVLDEDIKTLGLTREDLRRWTPPRAARGRGRKKKVKGNGSGC